MVWQPAIPVDVLTEGAGISLVLPGRKKPVAVFRYQNAFYAVSNECPHAHAPLSGSMVRDHIITCPWHGARFDIRTGESLGPQVCEPLRTFLCQVKEGRVYVDI